MELWWLNNFPPLIRATYHYLKSMYSNLNSLWPRLLNLKYRPTSRKSKSMYSNRNSLRSRFQWPRTYHSLVPPLQPLRWKPSCKEWKTLSMESSNQAKSGPIQIFHQTQTLLSKELMHADHSHKTPPKLSHGRESLKWKLARPSSTLTSVLTT